MSNLTQQLDNIEVNVRHLVEKINNLKQENDTLRIDNNQLRTELAQQIENGGLEQNLKGTHQPLKQKLDAVPTSSQDLRKEIDIYISEIDKCIEWLQNH